MIIAAVKTREELDAAKQSGVKIIFDLNPGILSLEEVVREAHSCGKRIFLHMDLAEGIGKDKAGLQYVKQKKVDGIISTRVNIIKAARDVGLFTVQRFLRWCHPLLLLSSVFPSIRVFSSKSAL